MGRGRSAPWYSLSYVFVGVSMFKNSGGKWLSTGLFYETAYPELSNVVYCLKGEDRELPDGRKIKSLRKIYVSLDDPTEYRVATEYLGGWEHWKVLLNSPVIRSHIDEWREELEMKLRAQGLKQIVAAAAEDKAFQAAKYLADKGWLETGNKAKTKKAKEKERAQQKELQATVTEDAKRLGLIN